MIPDRAVCVADPVDEYLLRMRRQPFVDPEREIRIAMLAEAFSNLRIWRAVRVPKPSVQVELVRLEAWFADPNAAWPFSCVALCEALHLDVGLVRRAAATAALCPTARRRAV